jgi:hypothetical protein
MTQSHDGEHILYNPWMHDFWNCPYIFILLSDLWTKSPSPQGPNYESECDKL